MTKHEFQELTQNIVLLDGATGSNLMAAGMPKGVCTEEWVLAQGCDPEASESLHRSRKQYYLRSYFWRQPCKPYHAWSAGPYGGDQPHSGFLFKRSRGCGRP